MVLAGLVALPLSVSAQDGDESATSEPKSQEPAASAESAPEEPALQLKLDDAGVGVAPPPPRTIDGYTLEETRLRVRRAEIGLGVSAGVVGAGLAMALVAGLAALAQWGNDKPFDRAEAALAAALAISSAGIIGMVTAGGILAHRKRKARKFEHYETPRRVHWDLARSRLVF